MHVRNDVPSPYPPVLDGGVSRRDAMLGGAMLTLSTSANGQAHPFERILDSARMHQIDGIIREAMSRRQIPGLTLVVVQHGRIMLRRSWGLVDLELRVPADPRHLFQSGSVGKMFTADAILELARHGQLRLDEPVTRYLPAAPTSWSQISIGDLLRHRSGIADYEGADFDLRRDRTNAELLDAFGKVPLDFEPGTRFAYSNSGFAVLGFVIDRITGRDYAEYLASAVFAPAAMPSAQVNDIDAIIANRASGYVRRGPGLAHPGFVARALNRTGDGSLLLCADDLAAWLIALEHRDAQGRQASLSKLAMQAYPDGSVPVTPYAAGWYLSHVRNRRTVFHGGRWQGFSSAIARWPDDGLGLALLCNVESARPLDFAAAIAAVFDPQLGPLLPIADEQAEQTADDRRTVVAFLAAGGSPSGTAQQARTAIDLGPMTAPVVLTLVDRLRDARTYRIAALPKPATVTVSTGGKIVRFDTAFDAPV